MVSVGRYKMKPFWICRKERVNQKIGIIVKTVNRDYPIFKIEILWNNTKSNCFLYRERNISIGLLKG